MRADDIAVARTRYRADDGAAFARGRRAPVNRKAQFAAGRRMRREADMIGSIGLVIFVKPELPELGLPQIQMDKARHRRRASAFGLVLGFKGRLDSPTGSNNPSVEVVL